MRYGIVTRLLLALAGLFLLSANGGLLFGILLGARERPGLGQVAIVSLAFGLPALLGLLLVRWAVRGRRSTPNLLGRADAFLQRRMNYITLIFAALVLLGLGICNATGRPTPAWDPTPQVMFFICIFLLVSPVHVLIHELGHALVGSLVGFRVSSIRVGGLVVSYDRRRPRLGWQWTGIEGFLGITFASPRTPGVTRLAWATYVLGGPLASLAAAWVCHGIAESQSVRATGPLLGLAFRAATWSGFGLSIMSVVPHRTKSGFLSDGALLLSLSRRAPRGAALAFRLWQQAPGRRPREWGHSAEELARAAADANPDSRMMILYYAVAVARDSGRPAVAAELLARALNEPGPVNVLWKLEFELQAVMAAALLDSDAAGARARLAAMGPHPTAPKYPLLAEAAVALAEGKPGHTESALRLWMKAAEDAGLSSRWRAGNEWALEMMQARLQRQAGPLGTGESTL